MKKVIKGILITSASFLAVGVILTAIGGIGGSRREFSEERYKNAGVLDEMTEKLDWLPIFHMGHRSSSGSKISDKVEYDRKHETVHGEFTDETIHTENIRNLEIEMGDGELLLTEGDAFRLKKEGEAECQYYIEDNTLYVKSKMTKKEKNVSFILTIPKTMEFDEVELLVGAGELVTKGTLKAKELEIDIGAGSAKMETVDTGEFSAEIGAGELVINRLLAGECDMSVAVGCITVENGIISGNLDVETDMGEIELVLQDSYENHSYEVECNMGEITLKSAGGTKTYSGGLGNEMTFSGRNAVGSEYELSCNMGTISLSFEDD